MNETLRKIEALSGRSQLDSWADIDKLTGGQKQSGLLKFVMSVCSNLPELTIDTKKNITDQIALIGRVMTKHIVNSNSYTRYMTIIRKELINGFGNDIIPVMLAGRISDSERTKGKNAHQVERRNKRHESSFNISISEIMEIIGAMVEDLDSGEAKYKNTILLLFELCTGARLGEVMSFGKFKPEGKYSITQEGILKQKESSAAATKVKIPTLFDAKYLVDHLNKWRADNKITPGTYSIELASETQKKANRLLRSRYIAGDLENGDIRSHLLRAIYANAAFKLAGGTHETLSGFIGRVLGHTGLETGLSYSFVKITEDDPEDEHKPADFKPDAAAQ